MKAKQKENLQKLARYLTRLPKLKHPKADFDMRAFTPDVGFNVVVNCGTVGCAAGHGPYAGVRKFKNEHWRKYVRRAFGVPPNPRVFEWLFGHEWERTDNTPQGAAARIRWYLKHGVPGDAGAQRWGTEPLCYVKP